MSRIDFIKKLSTVLIEETKMTDGNHFEEMEI